MGGEISENRKVLLQKLQKKVTAFEKGIIYYSLISIINKLALTPYELRLLSFINRRGNIAAITAKTQFICQFDSSIGTVNNMVSKLVRKGLLIKQSGKIVINPVLNLDMGKPVILNLTLDTAIQHDDEPIGKGGLLC